MTYPRVWHYYNPEDYFKRHSYIPHADLTVSLGPIRLGSTIRCTATFYDEDGAREDPSSTPTIWIYDPTETAYITNQAMTKDSDYTATYYYNYYVAVAGKPGLWRFAVKATTTLEGESWIYHDSMPFQVFRTVG